MGPGKRFSDKSGDIAGALLHFFCQLANLLPQKHDGNGDQRKDHDRDRRVFSAPDKNKRDIEKNDQRLFHQIRDHIRDRALDLADIVRDAGEKIAGAAFGVKIMGKIDQMAVEIVPDFPDREDPHIGHLIIRDIIKSAAQNEHDDQNDRDPNNGQRHRGDLWKIFGKIRDIVDDHLVLLDKAFCNDVDGNRYERVRHRKSEHAQKGNRKAPAIGLYVSQESFIDVHEEVSE